MSDLEVLGMDFFSRAGPAITVRKSLLNVAHRVLVFIVLDLNIGPLLLATLLQILVYFSFEEL